jgi:hypothetical protein
MSIAVYLASLATALPAPSDALSVPAEYGTEESTSALANSLLSWVQPGETTTIFDRLCRPMRVQRVDEQLIAQVDVSSKTQGNRKTVRSRELIIDSALALTSGSTTGYTRREGHWVETDSSGMSDAKKVGDTLSKIESDAAWFDAVPVTFGPGCLVARIETTACGARERVCRSCQRWALVPRGVDPSHGFAIAPEHQEVRRQADDCSAACAPDSPPPELSLEAAKIKGKMFYDLSITSHPYLFRTRAACDRYGHNHALSKAGRLPW